MTWKWMALDAICIACIGIALLLTVYVRGDVEDRAGAPGRHSAEQALFETANGNARGDVGLVRGYPSERAVAATPVDGVRKGDMSCTRKEEPGFDVDQQCRAAVMK